MTRKEDTEPLSCHIDGMDCPDCAAKIEKVVANLAEVSDANVNFTDETLTAKVESPEAIDKVLASVRSLGYRISEKTRFITTVLEIQELDCSEDIAVIEKTIAGLPGMKQVDTNLISQRLNVIHDPQVLGVEQIISVLKKSGLHARPRAQAGEAGGFWERNGRMLSTIVAGVFTGLGLALHFLEVGELWEKGVYIIAISGGWFIARRGIAAVRHGTLDMNFLMTAAVIGAVFIDAWDEAAMVVFLFAVAQILEGRAMDRARNAVRALMKLAPPTARVLRQGQELDVAVEQVQPGEIFRLRPGEKIPLDGEVVDGHSALNQAPITGESIPVDKVPGDEVYAGSINGQGSLDVRATHRAADTTLAHIIHLIEEAQAARAPSQAFVDRFAKVYTPAVLVVAVLIASLPPLLFSQPFGEWFYRALVLLVIACPCALVISTPMAIVSGLARGARAGVLIKGGMHLENAGHLRALAMDKTGTLTEGRPQVQDVDTLDNTPREELLRIACSLEARSEHPLAKAIRDYGRHEGVTPAPISDFEALLGRGVQGKVEGHTYILGNHRLFEERGLCSPEIEKVLEAREQEGKTVIIIGSTKKVLGLVSIADQLRPEAREAIERLRYLGIRHISMLTGDNKGTARAIADKLGIDEPLAELLPMDKVDAVKELVRQYGKVGMVGDGVNDAPAMAAATAGIAMGAVGTDAAMETADIVLMGDDLSRLPFAIRLSRKTLHVIRQNIGLALGLKAIFLVLAIPGYATLWMAVFADMGASMLVIANSLRLLRIRDR